MFIDRDPYAVGMCASHVSKILRRVSSFQRTGLQGRNRGDVPQEIGKDCLLWWTSQ
jgi:hypothetical protein